MKNKFFKNGELQDKQIVKALHHAAEDYENGEIFEVKCVLVDIINAITDFENDFEKINEWGRTNMRKERKLRDFKKNGKRSEDFCEYCYKPGCDPFGGSPKYRKKVEKRLEEGKCPACGNVKCTCKSSVLSPARFEDRAKSRVAKRCEKCVWEMTCTQKHDAENCKNYKRDALDGGYYG